MGHVLPGWEEIRVVGDDTGALRPNSEWVRKLREKCRERDRDRILRNTRIEWTDGRRDARVGCGVESGGLTEERRSPSPRQPLIYFLSLQICLFWTFYINAVLDFIAFLSSGFFLSVQCFQGSSML